MRKQIDQVFSESEEIPLFYVESGSRLWGIASPDSDYDVRGFHLQSKKQYFDFKKHRDIIEIMDGGNEEIFEQWTLEGCFLETINYNNLDYSSSDAVDIQMTVRFDNATLADGLFELNPQFRSGVTIG